MRRCFRCSPACLPLEAVRFHGPSERSRQGPFPQSRQATRGALSQRPDGSKPMEQQLKALKNSSQVQGSEGPKGKGGKEGKGAKGGRGRGLGGGLRASRRLFKQGSPGHPCLFPLQQGCRRENSQTAGVASPRVLLFEALWSVYG